VGWAHTQRQTVSALCFYRQLTSSLKQDYHLLLTCLGPMPTPEVIALTVTVIVGNYRVREGD